jgi:predicted N-acetyltransferase YhbS
VRTHEPAAEHGGRALADGYRLRDAVPPDREPMLDVLADRMGDEVAAEAVAAIDEQGLDHWVVAEHDGDVVGCSTLLVEAWELHGTSLGVGMPDFVATRPDHEGRGLVRAQLGLHHARSEDHGDALQAIVGIPYFYRRFGYAYPLATQHGLALADPAPRAPAGTTVRAMTEDDLPAAEAIQARTLAAAELVMRHQPSTWRAMLACDHLELLVAERGGRVVATARLAAHGDTVHVLDLAGAPDGLDALLATAADRADTVRVQRRPDPDVSARLVDAPTRSHAAVFVRVPDLVYLLDQLRPVLDARLDAADVEVPERLVVSRYLDAAELTFADGEVTSVRSAPATRTSTSGTLRVPPDEVASLLLGPDGAAMLEEGHPDVLLGDTRELASVLFPPVVSDLLTWVPPY